MRSAAGAARLQRILVAVVVVGAVVIAAIGFAGSYTAVRDLAERKGFGAFAPYFPIGVDAGIVVLLALDLLLTWIRIPFPLLRQTAWLLTAATIAFNGAAAWPDPLGVGMHAVIPVLFVVTVEAARHAAGRMAEISADKHMEGVRLSRWLLAFPSTFRMWRRMKLWELRRYDEVIRMEQDRLVYETRLRTRYGRSWRRTAPVEALIPLKLTRYGIPLATTVPSAELHNDVSALLDERPPAGISTRVEPNPALSRSPQPVPAADDRLPEPQIPNRAASPGAPVGESNSSQPGVAAPVRHKDRAPRRSAAVEREFLPQRQPEPEESDTSSDDAIPGRASGESPHGSHHVKAEGSAEAQQHPGTVSKSQDDAAGGSRPETHEVAQRESPAGEGRRSPTLVDRYYQAWAELTDKLGTEPAIQDLSDHLWVRGMAGRSGGQISPSTLRRYRMGWRIYRVWAQRLEDNGGVEPSLRELEELCAEHAIRSKGGRGGERLEQNDLAGYLTDFRRRYAALGQ
ncbi:DUF2637 domain-containing protein [Streptomyces sp. NPDC007063]|uniref:DUF2637 domain-containing protein n=3 Tax=unclassified Streptomyces TaxID=2593676 RepID=UPI0036C20FE5